MVSDIVTDSLTAFGLKAEDSGRFADMLAAAASNANTNVSMLGESFKYVAPVAGSMGYSVKDVTTALGLMANAGIKGGEAGTSLRSVLTRLAKPTKEVYGALEALNVSAVNADGSMKPLNELIPELREKFSGLTAKEKGAYATMIAGKNAMSGFLAVVSAGEEDFNLLANAISNSSGAAQAMADIKLDTLQGKITLLQSQFDGVKLAIFNGLGSSNFKNALGAISDQITAAMPAITKMAEKIGEWLGELVQRLPEIIAKIKEFGSWVKDTITEVKDFVGGWKNLAKILAGLAIAPTFISGLKTVWSLGKFIKIALGATGPILGGLSGGFGAIAAAAAPIIGIIAGIAAVIYTVVRNFDNLTQYALD
jgi:TP901 family phage tail tape measure protein